MTMPFAPDAVLPRDKLHQITHAIQTATGIACAILTIEGDVVCQSGHQRICSRFHRKHAQARRSCLRHSTNTLNRLAASRDYLLLQCPHGLVDMAAPIVTNGTHVANVFLGQFLLSAAEMKTRRRFEKQAARYGFDREAYLEALQAVPVYPEAKIKPLVVCLTQTAELIANLSLDHLRQKKMAVSLRESEKRFRLVADFTYDWEYWIAPDGAFVYVSPSCKRISGHGPEDFARRPQLFLDLIHPEDRPNVERHLKKEMDAPGHARLDFRIVDPVGTVKWISHFCQPVYDDDGRWLGRRASNREITDRKQVEEALIRRDGELQEKSARLEKANQALKALLDHREAEKKAIEAHIYDRLQKLILPFLEKTRRGRLDPVAANYLDLAVGNLNELLRGGDNGLYTRYRSLSPTEIKVAELVRQGQRTKQIAATLHLAPSSVASYRKSIRRKLDVVNAKVNLRAFLTSLAEKK
jgi:PAS domain S-box-containing protein